MGFVTDKLTALSSLLNSDVTQARAELLRHVTEIRLIPQETTNGGDYVAVGNWDLLGSCQEMDRARHLPVYALGWLRGLDLNQRPPGYEPA